MVALLVGCDSKREPVPAMVPSVPAPPAQKPAIDARIAALPGVLWFVDDASRALVRLARGVRTEVTLTDARLFPSRWSLPDGRLVAIASRGDGSADAEQLALVTADGAIARVGPKAAMVRDPAVARDGSWVVVAANPDGHMDLYRIDLANPTATQITRDPQGNFAPVVLAGDAIAFASSRDDNSEIYRVTVDGKGTAQRLTAFHKDDFAPAASPDGTTLAFASDREGPVRIFVMAADGTKLRKLTTRGHAGDELDHTWSRDGKLLAYLVDGHVFVRDLAAATERDLTPAGARDAEPSFSPDGAWLAVSRDTAIVAIELATGTPLRVTTAGAPRLPRWQ